MTTTLATAVSPGRHDTAWTTTVPEPADGAKVVLYSRYGSNSTDYCVYHRDDAVARERNAEPNERWFSEDPQGDFPVGPSTWAEALAYAVAVYAVSAEPLAEAGR